MAKPKHQPAELDIAPTPHGDALDSLEEALDARDWPKAYDIASDLRDQLLKENDGNEDDPAVRLLWMVRGLTE